MTDEETELRRRWESAAHAMQSGVSTEMQVAPQHSATEPKHLRVGINTALVDHASLVELLIQKGLITRIEYLKAIAEGMENEKERYEANLSELLGKEVRLA